VKTVTHEEVSSEELGGADTHGGKSGVAHFACDGEVACLEGIRELMEYLPANNREDPPERLEAAAGSSADPGLLIPASPLKPYDMTEVIRCITDGGRFFEVHRHFAGNILVGFAHIGGRAVGIVANQPAVLAGVLDIDASRKAARFVRFCDAFNIPLVVFEDVPGFLPGTDQEWRGIIVHGAKLLYAFCEATVPRITVITRKAYGGAYDVMNSKHIRGDMNFAWPSAEIAVMGPKGAAEIIFRREIEQAENREEALARREAEYREMFAHPYRAAARGYVDAVIEPAETRSRLIHSLGLLASKVDTNPRKKHGNIPL
jgi:propionyl-CoA carboxylase beta chain